VQGRYGGLADLDEAPERLVPALVAPAVPQGMIEYWRAS